MKTIITALVLTLTATFAHAERFFTAGEFGDSSWIRIEGFDLIHFSPTWTFDFETDGQSIYFDQLRFEFDGRIDFPEHEEVYFDVVISGAMDGTTLDINPVPGKERWQMEPWKFANFDVKGTYHSFAFTNEIDTEAYVSPPYGRFNTLLDFGQYPQQVDVFGDANDYNRAHNLSGLFDLEPRLPVTGINIAMDRDIVLPGLLHPFASSAIGDFDADADTDGADFELWQKGYTGDYGSGALQAWSQNYAAELAAASLGSIPEPATIWLALLGVAGLAARRKQRSQSKPHPRYNTGATAQLWTPAQ